MSKALYPGSFDPLTLGHQDIISKAVQTFDKLEIAVGKNPAKKGFFETDRRIDLIESSLSESTDPAIIDAMRNARISISSYQNISIIKYAHLLNASHIVRGLRQAGDFNDEFALTGAAGHLDSDVIFTHFICKERYLHVSSSTARELASLDEDVSWLVSPSVDQALRDEFAFRKLYASKLA